MMTQALMELEVDQRLVADRYQRTLERRASGTAAASNSDIRGGNLELSVPRARWQLLPWHPRTPQASRAALVATVREAYGSARAASTT
jgi:hypothetical protein